MRSGMASKHDEMLIYILCSADLATTAGTNLLLSGEKSQCWRQATLGTTAEMDRPLLEVF